METRLHTGKYPCGMRFRYGKGVHSDGCAGRHSDSREELHPQSLKDVDCMGGGRARAGALCNSDGGDWWWCNVEEIG